MTLVCIFNVHRLQCDSSMFGVNNLSMYTHKCILHTRAHTRFTFEHHLRLSDPSSLWSSPVFCQTGWASSGGSAALWLGSTHHHLLPHWQENITFSLLLFIWQDSVNQILHTTNFLLSSIWDQQMYIWLWQEWLGAFIIQLYNVSLNI